MTLKNGNSRFSSGHTSTSSGPNYSTRSGFRPKAQPKVVRELIRSTFSRFGIDEQISRYQFVLDWEKIVGPKIASCSRPHSLERGILVIRVVNSEWAQELAFQKEVILSRLVKYSLDSGDAETGRVTDIRFVVGPK